MSQSKSQKSGSLREQLAEQRWNRVRAVSARSNEERGLRTPQRRKPSAPAAEPQPRLLSWLITGAGVMCCGSALFAVLPWLMQPGADDIQAGQELFVHKWEPGDALSTQGDGLGPVFNAHSCAECHFQGGIGGGGGLQHNVAAFEVLPTIGHPDPTGGVIHAFAVQSDLQESAATMRTVFPIIPEGKTITAVCQAPLKQDYDPVVRHSINTPTLFGAGIIDGIPTPVILAHQAQRLAAGVGDNFHLKFDATSAGRVRTLPDGRIGRFGWKAQFATLEEFVANACAVEVGLTTPTRKQHIPKEHREDPEAKPDLDRRQFWQLMAFVSQLPAPKPAWTTAAPPAGFQVFTSIGCADCHTPDLGAAEGIYSDLCLHTLDDSVSASYGTVTPEVPIPEDYPLASEWKTPPLWGAADTAPYMHDGSAATFDEAIEAHGGQARNVRERFRKLSVRDRQSLLEFLSGLTTAGPAI